MQLGTVKNSLSPSGTVTPSSYLTKPSKRATLPKKADTSQVNTKQTMKSCKYKNCTFETRNVKELRAHVKDCHQNSPRFECVACGYRVNHKSHWDKHCTSRKHSELTAKGESVDVGSETSVTVRQDSSYACNICSLSFDAEVALHKHRMTHSVTSEEDLLKRSQGDALKYLDVR